MFAIDDLSFTSGADGSAFVDTSALSAGATLSADDPAPVAAAIPFNSGGDPVSVDPISLGLPVTVTASVVPASADPLNAGPDASVTPVNAPVAAATGGAVDDSALDAAATAANNANNAAHASTTVQSQTSDPYGVFVGADGSRTASFDVRLAAMEASGLNPNDPTHQAQAILNLALAARDNGGVIPPGSQTTWGGTPHSYAERQALLAANQDIVPTLLANFDKFNAQASAASANGFQDPAIEAPYFAPVVGTPSPSVPTAASVGGVVNTDPVIPVDPSLTPAIAPTLTSAGPANDAATPSSVSSGSVAVKAGPLLTPLEKVLLALGIGGLLYAVAKHG